MRGALVLLAAVLLTAAESDEVFVDAGACPGEACVYGEQWTAREPVELRASPAEAAAVVATLSAQERVETVTGEVHTRPGRFVVKKARDGFEPGAVLLLYTYLGERWYRARHEGALVRADLGFGPYGRRCREPDDDRCWGVLERRAQSRWWVRVRRSSGLEGWVLDSRSLEKLGAH